VELIDTFNQAWNAHDLDAALALTTEDCVFESTGPAPDGQRFEGREQIAGAWRPIFDDTSSRFTVEEAFSAGEDRFVQCWRYEWTDGHVRGVDVFHLRDGRVAAKLSYVKG
jgi:uncharacterized protein (TIGR02246 family)